MTMENESRLRIALNRDTTLRLYITWLAQHQFNP